jgi:antitoxin VapB
LRSPNGLLRRQGISIEDAVKLAIEQSAREIDVTLARIGNRRMRAISERFARYPVLDPRSPDEIIGYDEFGLPK